MPAFSLAKPTDHAEPSSNLSVYATPVDTQSDPKLVERESASLASSLIFIVPGVLMKPPMEVTLMIWPQRLSRIPAARLHLRERPRRLDINRPRHIVRSLVREIRMDVFISPG